MKKILFATTALVASTSFAMADVDLSGSAEMGIFGGGGDVDVEDQFHTDIDVTFSMSGETDGGLTFGASVDLDEGGTGSAAHADDSDDGGATIFVSGVYGTLTMGDTDGALDWAMDEAIIGSSLGDNHEHVGYNGNSLMDGFDGLDGQIARYDYSFGDFAVAVSAEVRDTDAGDDTYGIGFTYDGDLGGIALGVGLGYQENDGSSGLGFSASMSMDSGLSAILNYTDYDDVAFASNIGAFGVGAGAEVEDHLGLAVGYEFGAFLVAANYGIFDLDGGDVSGIGVIANYDLGGGASLQLGYGHNDLDSDDVAIDDASYNTYSFGIAMSF